MSAGSIATRGYYGGSGSAADTTPPTITVVSPTPGVAPGDPGGFPADRALAELTPIVIEVSDVSPGVEYICIVAEYPGLPAEPVFRRGNFIAPYLGSSYALSGATATMTVQRLGGWPRPSDPTVSSYIKFSVDAIDASGNIDGGTP